MTKMKTERALPNALENRIRSLKRQQQVCVTIGHKSSNVKRKLRKSAIVSAGDQKRIDSGMPY